MGARQRRVAQNVYFRGNVQRISVQSEFVDERNAAF